MPTEVSKTERECHPINSAKMVVPSGQAEETPGAPPTAPPVPPRMRSSWLDRSALKNLQSGSAEDLAKLFAIVDARMASLSDEPETARLNLLSKLIAITSTKVELLESTSDRLVSAGNFPLVREVQRVLDATHRHLAALLAEHRLATQGNRRAVTVAVVSQNTQVNVQAGR